MKIRFDRFEGFERFLVSSRQAKCVDALFGLCSDALQSIGFDQLMYAIVSEDKRLASDTELGLVNHNMLNDWVEYYRDNNYLEADKTTHLLRANPGIYSWETIKKRYDLSGLQRKILSDAADANMHHGNSISFHGPQGVKSVMIASTSVKTYKPNQQQLDMLHAVSHQFNACFMSLTLTERYSSTVSLSAKELEVLKWSAIGMTKREIAEKINVSPHTVDYHSRKILQKLDVKNITSALAVSIKQGLLTL